MPVEQPSAIWEEPIRFEESGVESYESFESAEDEPTLQAVENGTTLSYSRRSHEELFSPNTLLDAASYGQPVSETESLYYVSSSTIQEIHPDFYAVMGGNTVEYIITAQCDGEGNPLEITNVELLINHDWPASAAEATQEISADSYTFVDGYRVSKDENEETFIEYYDQARGEYIPLIFLEGGADPHAAQEAFNEMQEMILAATETGEEQTNYKLRLSRDGESFSYSEDTYSLTLEGTVEVISHIQVIEFEDILAFLEENPELECTDGAGNALTHEQIRGLVEIVELDDEASSAGEDTPEPPLAESVSFSTDQITSAAETVVVPFWKAEIIESENTPLPESLEGVRAKEIIPEPSFHWETTIEDISIQHVLAQYTVEAVEVPQDSAIEMESVESIALQAIITVPESLTTPENVSSSETIGTVEIEVTISAQDSASQVTEERTDTSPKTPPILYRKTFPVPTQNLHTLFETKVLVPEILSPEQPRTESVPLKISTTVLRTPPVLAPDRDLQSESPFAQASDIILEIPAISSIPDLEEAIPVMISKKPENPIVPFTLELISDLPAVIDTENKVMQSQEEVAAVIENEEAREMVTLYSAAAPAVEEKKNTQYRVVEDQRVTTVEELLGSREEKEVSRASRGSRSTVQTQQTVSQAPSLRKKLNRHQAQQVAEMAAAEIPEERSERFEPGIIVRGLPDLTPVEQLHAKKAARDLARGQQRKFPIEFTVIRQGKTFYLEPVKVAA